MVQPQTRQRRRDRTGDTSRRATGHNSQSSSAINRITSNPNLPNCKVLLVISISLVLGFILYYYYSSGGRIDDSRPISHILRDQVDQCETLVTLELQLENALGEDPFVEIVKTRIQPALDTVSSVRTQTHKYEAMERIPGGPVSFVKEASKRLDDVEKNIIKLVRSEEGRILARKMDEIKTMIRDYQKHHQESLESALASITPLGNEGIFLAPIRISKAQEERLMSEVTFAQHISKLSNLAKLFETLERMEAEMEEYKTRKEAGKAVDEDSLSRLIGSINQVQDAIDEDLEVNGDVYKLSINFRHDIMHKISHFQDQFIAYELEKKQPYRQLVDMLEVDISIARIRLESLKMGILS